MTAVESPRPSSRPNRSALLLVVGLLLVSAVAAYRNTLAAPFVWDDGGSIAENTTIRHLRDSLHPPASGYSVSGRPVMNVSLALNYAISGEAEWSYHLLNLTIHLLAACTLFGLVRRTLARPPLAARFAGSETSLAATIAALWLLHPVQTESVTYVSQRTESLAGLFFLLTAYAFVRSIEAAQPWRWRAAAFLACVLGAGTKEIVATAPVLLFLYDRTFVAGSFRRAWAERRGFHLGLAATWVLIAALVAGTGWNRGGTAGFNVGVSFAGYWLTQFQAMTDYLRLSVWPCPLIFDHGTFWANFREAAPYALIVVPVIIATIVALWRWPELGFLGAWFWVILAPTSLVPGTIQMIVEHRMYLPLAAVLTLLVAGVHRTLGRRSLVVWSLAAVAFGALTFFRNQTYASDLELWRDTVAKAPANARARYSLGIAYSERKQYALAVEQGVAALAVDDRGFYANKAHLVHNKLGHDLAMLGRTQEAEAHYREAFRLDPNYAIAHRNLARLLVQTGRYSEAVDHFEAALRRHFGGAATEMELSDALMHEGRMNEAVTHLRIALEDTPRWAPGWNNLGYALLLTGNTDRSIAAYEKAVHLDPRYAGAWVGLGYALITAGRPADAVAPCTEAVKLQPSFADAHNTLGIALAQTGKLAQARTCFERAIQLDGRGADVHNNLGNVLAALGNHADALAQYREAVRLNPDYSPAQRNLGEELRRAGHLTEAAVHLEAAERLEAGGNRAP